MTLENITLILIFAILVFHWLTELKSELILDIPNFLLFLIGVTRLFYVHSDDLMWYLSGFGLAIIVPYIVFQMGGYFGGGTYKLLIASGLILGVGQIAITLLVTPFIYRAYVWLCEKYSWYRYPSGVSVLACLPLQLFYIYIQ